MFCFHPGMQNPTMIRIGLPLVGGALPAAARAMGAPVLVSANALAVYRADESQASYDAWLGTLSESRRARMPAHPVRDFARFRTSPDLDGLDVALDSAGFVAWAHYGGFPWTVEAYVRLAGSRAWSWWAQMDACCEAEIAGSRGAVRLRQAETIRLLGECRRVARAAGVSAPMPVLQGSRASDYVWHLEQIDLDGATLVGVGSMCRRDVGGVDGLLGVVAALDRVLPAGVRLHLFGVKSTGLEQLAAHPRVASIDSMAWDVDARATGRKATTGCTMEVRTAAMRRWFERQTSRAASATSVPGMLGVFEGEDDDVPEVYSEWADLVAGDEIELSSAGICAAREACYA